MEKQSARLVLIGAGDQAPRIRSAADALGVRSHVHVEPMVSYNDLPRVYASADVVVAPSLTTPYWEEQFGMVLVEALASGRALLSTSSGAIPEVVGDAARLVRPYDVPALSAALEELLGDDTMRKQLETAGRERALTKYDVRVVASQVVAAYESVLSA